MSEIFKAIHSRLLIGKIMSKDSKIKDYLQNIKVRREEA